MDFSGVNPKEITLSKYADHNIFIYKDTLDQKLSELDSHLRSLANMQYKVDSKRFLKEADLFVKQALKTLKLDFDQYWPVMNYFREHSQFYPQLYLNLEALLDQEVMLTRKAFEPEHPDKV